MTHLRAHRAIRRSTSWVRAGVWLLGIGALAGCTQYPNTKALCKGHVFLKLEGMVGNGQTLDREEIGMRIENDSISFSGNLLIGGDQIKLCKIGSIEYARKDELYFDTSGCTREGKENISGRTYGTYNYITRKLTLSHQDHKDLTGGSFACQDTK